MTEEKTKTLYGNVNLNDYYFEWHSEPGACEKCQALDGKTFDDANTIPDKPHPNCKCWIERKKNPSTDPIQQHRDKIQEQKDLELEFEKLKGDLRCLEAECDKSIEIIDNELDTIEKFEYTINPEYLKPLDVEKIQEVKQELENNKQEVIKTKISINKYKDNFKPIGTIKEISTLEFRINELKEQLNNLYANIKLHGLTYGIWVKGIFEKDAAALWDMSVTGILENDPYIRKNGEFYFSISNLKDKNLENKVRDKIQKQLGKENSKGVVFNNKSSLAKNIQKSANFQNKISEIKEELIKKRHVGDKTLEFKSGNLYHALHFVDLIDIHLDEEDNLSLKILDTYDFNPNEKHILVQTARDLQEKSKLETFYTITEIKIPYNKWINY
ncbi:hypothetical protein IKP85_00795 [bacterium]|nr:hypothetical protein [bacterium]